MTFLFPLCVFQKTPFGVSRRFDESGDHRCHTTARWSARHRGASSHRVVPRTPSAYLHRCWVRSLAVFPARHIPIHTVFAAGNIPAHRATASRLLLSRQRSSADVPGEWQSCQRRSKKNGDIVAWYAFKPQPVCLHSIDPLPTPFSQNTTTNPKELQHRGGFDISCRGHWKSDEVSCE